MDPKIKVFQNEQSYQNSEEVMNASNIGGISQARDLPQSLSSRTEPEIRQF